ncbi:MAG: Gfo/Idh/MocA family oxidoreductase [Chloroflexi bacterium]|nr:Gfo/Idh/MocA family oxidoreductase [Chloroflexota bacterium]
MPASFRVGVIGFAHMHVNELMRVFSQLSNIVWVACADTIPTTPEKVNARFTRGWNLQHALTDVGIPRSYTDYRQMLERERFDILLFCPENARHGEVAEAIAGHGAHMITEKPMAASLAEAQRMVEAASNAGVRLAINWPITWSPAVRTAKRVIDEGIIGRPLEVKWRGGSRGPLSHGSTHPGIEGTAVEMTDEERGATWWYQASAGGGALLDYCCYGACLSQWYLGDQALDAFGLRVNLNSPYGDADDNAIISVRFPHAIGLIEATWTTVDHGITSGPIIYGETGTLVVDRAAGQQQLRLLRGGGQPAEILPLDPLPPGRTTLAEEFVHHLTTGEALHPTLEPPFNLRAMAILDAGIRSAQSGQREGVAQI